MARFGIRFQQESATWRSILRLPLRQSLIKLSARLPQKQSRDRGEVLPCTATGGGGGGTSSGGKGGNDNGGSGSQGGGKGDDGNDDDDELLSKQQAGSENLKITSK